MEIFVVTMLGKKNARVFEPQILVTPGEKTGKLSQKNDSPARKQEFTQVRKQKKYAKKNDGFSKHLCQARKFC